MVIDLIMAANRIIPCLQVPRMAVWERQNLKLKSLPRLLGERNRFIKFTVLFRVRIDLISAAQAVWDKPQTTPLRNNYSLQLIRYLAPMEESVMRPRNYRRILRSLRILKSSWRGKRLALKLSSIRIRKIRNQTFLRLTNAITILTWLDLILHL